MTDAIVVAGVRRAVVGIEDPDPRLTGGGIAASCGARLGVSVGQRSAEIEAQLAPHLVHRRSGRPFVILKLAATVDGRIAAANGTSRWISVRADDPALTVRHTEGRDPLGVVLGRALADARVRPCLELDAA